MMNRTNVSTIVKQAIEAYLDKGLTDKNDIYSKVIEELGIPRPTIRRIARDLREEYERRIKILQNEIPKPSDPTNQNLNEIGDSIR